MYQASLLQLIIRGKEKKKKTHAQSIFLNAS